MCKGQKVSIIIDQGGTRKVQLKDYLAITVPEVLVERYGMSPLLLIPRNEVVVTEPSVHGEYRCAPIYTYSEEAASLVFGGSDYPIPILKHAIHHKDLKEGGGGYQITSVDRGEKIAVMTRHGDKCSAFSFSETEESRLTDDTYWYKRDPNGSYIFSFDLDSQCVTCVRPVYCRSERVEQSQAE